MKTITHRVLTLGDYLTGLRGYDWLDQTVREDPQACLSLVPEAGREEARRFLAQARAAMAEHGEYAQSFWKHSAVGGGAGDAPTPHLEVVVSSFAPGDYAALCAMPLEEALPYLSLRALSKGIAEKDAQSKRS
jgi:hypothetical protein